MTKEGPVDFKGKAMFVHALQGMKPHHAAAKWNFVDFQGDNYSAVMMEYTTPASYGSTVVAVGGIIKDGEILIAGSNNKVTHTAFNDDKENEWPEPSAVKYEWTGKSKDGKDVTAVIEGQLEKRLDKVDVMAEVPKFVKQFVAGAVGTKPYIYQVSPPLHCGCRRNHTNQHTVRSKRLPSRPQAQCRRRRGYRDRQTLLRVYLHLRGLICPF